MPSLDPESGTYQELTTLDATLSTKIPSSLSFVQAASIPLGYYAAYVGLFHPTAMGLPPPTSEPTDFDQPILVWGAGSIVGRSVIQLLSLAGYKNVLAVASAHWFSELKTYGAKVFDYKDQDVVNKIKGALDGKDLRLAYDVISLPPSLAEVAKLISPGGRVSDLFHACGPKILRK
ncbi:NAD(P)-binding protein [Clavulina sp. PMI_390]|nr:NAD(P)-binding protein [Clavulina sp. PMI_390]